MIRDALTGGGRTAGVPGGWEVSPFIAGVTMGRVLVLYLPAPAAVAL